MRSSRIVRWRASMVAVMALKMFFRGLDIGTSALKAVLVGEDQQVVATADAPIAPGVIRAGPGGLAARSHDCCHSQSGGRSEHQASRDALAAIRLLSPFGPLFAELSGPAPDRALTSCIGSEISREGALREEVWALPASSFCRRSWRRGQPEIGLKLLSRHSPKQPSDVSRRVNPGSGN